MLANGRNDDSPNYFGLFWTVCLIAISTSSGLACFSQLPGTDQHLLSGTIVRSSPPSPDSYERYIAVRLALDLDLKSTQWSQFRRSVDILLQRFPKDPQIWTLSAELAWREGDTTKMHQELNQALSIAPKFEPALQLQQRTRVVSISDNKVR